MRNHAEIKMRAARSIGVIACALLTSSCSVNPVVRWDPPEKERVPNYTMDYGITYAHTARSAYQKYIDQQSVMSGTLSSGLIGLGGIIAGLATFGAHRDTIVGAGLLGGTAYALGNWNYSKQRQLIYQAGIEGINCSIRAVTPLYMSSDELQKLNAAIAEVDRLAPLVLRKAEEADAELSGNVSADARDDAKAQITGARDAVAAANKTAVSGRQLATKVRRAGTELVNAVDRIDAAVGKAALDTLPDLTAVPKVVGGLAGFAGSFAPGAAAIISQANQVKPRGGSEGAGVRRGEQERAPELDRKLRELGALVDQLALAAQAVAAHTVGYDSALNTDGLSDCGIGNVASALRAAPDTITITASTDQTKRFLVSGGTKPYGSVLLDNLPEGLTVRNPAPFDSTFEVNATKSVKTNGQFNILVTDASNPYKSVQLTITVSSGSAGGDTRGDTTGVDGGRGSGRNAAGPATSVSKLLTGVDFTMSGGKNKETTFTVKEVVSDSPAKNDIGVKVVCDPVPNEPFAATAVRDELLKKKVGGDATLEQSLRALDPKAKDRIKFPGADKCVKTAAADTQDGRTRVSGGSAPEGDRMAVIASPARDG